MATTTTALMTRPGSRARTAGRPSTRPAVPGPLRPMAPHPVASNARRRATAARRSGRRVPTDARVYRRRRLAVAVLVAGVAFALGVLLALTATSIPAGGSLTDEARAARQVRHVVGEGDTLWSAASRLAPDEDPRVVVDALAAERGTSVVVPGDVLVWPVD